ncbi:MAG: hypothetical protein WCT23_04920 [Candidatus Neomarinimicrobiota bacterium]
MAHLITLLKTEYLKRKKTYWTPVWIIAGIMGGVILLGLIASWTHKVDVQVNMMDLSMFFEDMGKGMYVNAMGTMMLVVFAFSISLLINAPTSLSKEKQLGCDLFYRCQPINIWLNTAGKYIMHVLSGVLGVIVVGFIVTFILTIASAKAMGGFYLGAALSGMFVAVVLYFKVCLVFGSLFFLFSAIFKNSAIVKGLITMALIDFVFYLIEQIFRNTIDLPSIYQLLTSLLGDVNLNDPPGLGKMIWDVKFLISILFAGLCYTGGSLIYKYQRTEA